jgi:radical SAM protein with 4Fe4S-binding SPASM domain
MVNRIAALMKKIISTEASIGLPSGGVYGFTRQERNEKSKIHLRIDKDGHGILLVNASRIMHLNPTAALMAYFTLNQIPADKAIRAISSRYRVKRKQAIADYAQFVEQLDELLRPDGACPIHDLGLETIPPFSARPSAPYRMDLALTYRCNNDCSHCYNARPRSFPELSTTQWKNVLDRLWHLGISHIVFTGGEPTLRADLPELVAYAQQLGQITGVNSNGRRFADKQYVLELINAGLDHVQITLESHDPSIHDQMVRSEHAWEQTVQGIRNVIDSSLYVMTNTTLLRQNSPYLDQTLRFLSDLGVPTIGLNALIYAGKGREIDSGIPEEELHSLLELARKMTDENQQRLIWYTPTQYCNFDPVQMELGVKGCTAALYSMCIEPNGDVLPCQSYYQPVGNLLNDEWESIWQHPLCVGLRERQIIPQKCRPCSFLSECGGGCPLYHQEIAYTGG